jgi:hypothetical protein
MQGHSEGESPLPARGRAGLRPGLHTRGDAALARGPGGRVSDAWWARDVDRPSGGTVPALDRAGGPP